VHPPQGVVLDLGQRHLALRVNLLHVDRGGSDVGSFLLRTRDRVKGQIEANFALRKKNSRKSARSDRSAGDVRRCSRTQNGV